ncbi:uncharacterized protein LOC132607763 [Lycium barbarum]|uniref:uncharacterized protein LOC132607763 n=1 Tax=Lycium barbarum TaxID=112863 RepID=UPI00293E4DFA|nr:uncharacterized protein LOC132607763 [Lycium barbarum]
MDEKQKDTKEKDIETGNKVDRKEEKAEEMIKTESHTIKEQEKASQAHKEKKKEKHKKITKEENKVLLKTISLLETGKRNKKPKVSKFPLNLPIQADMNTATSRKELQNYGTNSQEDDNKEQQLETQTDQTHVECSSSLPSYIKNKKLIELFVEISCEPEIKDRVNIRKDNTISNNNQQSVQRGAKNDKKNKEKETNNNQGTITKATKQVTMKRDNSKAANF